MRRPTPHEVAEWFAAANLAFLGVDILIAHAENGFARRAEWIPVAFSGLATLLLVPGLLRPDRPGARSRGLGVGAAAIAVGLAGMIFHLESGFFVRQTLHQLVYAAPFVAPLAYVGVGLLLILNRLEGPGSPVWGPWVVLLALGGFVGNLALSLLDHAQNGFFAIAEWIPVIAASFAVSFLLIAVLRPAPAFLRLCLWVMALEAAVGVAGLVLHFFADANRGAASWLERFIYGAPPFAPMLFADLALLAAIGLWAMLRPSGGAA
jgi:hypothetical protein